MRGSLSRGRESGFFFITEEAFCTEFSDKRLMHLEQGTQDYFNHNLFCSFFQ